MKNKIVILFFFSFLSGIAFILICQNRDPDFFSYITMESCNNIVRMQWEYQRLFIRCLIKRLAPILILPILKVAGLRNLGMWLYFFWFFFSMGGVMEILILQYGLSGLGLFLTGVCPQYLFYIPAYFLLFFNDSRTVKKKYQYLLLCGVVIIGSFFESYVNPVLLKGYINLFLNYFYYI